MKQADAFLLDGRDKVKMTKGLFSSTTVECETPQDFFDRLNGEFHFGIDPCATSENAKCEKYITKEENGLQQSWKISMYGPAFVNPPYGREIGKWVKKAVEEARESGTVVMLLPARTDTKWWHEWVMRYAYEIRFIKGRLKFSGKGSAPFPSAVVVFRWRLFRMSYPEIKSMNAKE